jgi:hypothetical protein
MVEKPLFSPPVDNSPAAQAERYMRHVRIRYPKSLHPDTWEAIYAASVVGCFLRVFGGGQP